MQAQKKMNFNSELKKTYRSGFTLTEEELNNLIIALIKQLEKPPIKLTLTLIYFIEFNNGRKVKINSLDKVFKFDNSGSTEIVSIHIIGEAKNDELKRCLELSFINVDLENDLNKPSITYVIRDSSDDDDWVSSTNNLIEEKIRRVQRTNVLFNILLVKNSSQFLNIIIVLIIFSSPVLGALYNSLEYQAITEIQQMWERHKIQDFSDLLIKIETSKRQVFNSFLLNAILTVGCFTFVLSVIIHLIRFLYPKYCFCWGDARRNFKKKKKIRSILFPVLISIIISIITGLIVKYWL